MAISHLYNTYVQWTGNKGTGRSGYLDYERSHCISVNNKTVIVASSNGDFRAEAGKYKPGEL